MRQIILFSALTLISAGGVHAQIPQIERDALIALYDSTDGANWSNNTNWLGTVGTECTWIGIACVDGHVEELTLTGNHLNGSIPAELENLSMIENLLLTFNQLNGSIPPGLGNLSRLRNLFLGINQLSGSIPPELGNLSSLVRLNLEANQLSGSIPAELGNLPNLEDLFLGDNQLNGDIPPELGDLSSLRELGLQFNQLGGRIPPELANLSNLGVLQMQSNHLYGSIPVGLGNLTNLSLLLLDTNQLSGPIPPSLGNLSELLKLYLHSNQLTGSIPPSLGALARLWHLHLHNNQLNGTIPSQLGSLDNLRQLKLYSNQLSGSIPAELENLSSLGSGSLDLRWNALHSDDDSLVEFLDHIQDGGDWQSTQTIAPKNLVVEWVGDHTVWLRWNAVSYQSDPGGYEAYVTLSAGGSWVSVGRTASKTEVAIPATTLDPGVSYDLSVASYTLSHAMNSSAVVSEKSNPVMATTSSLGCTDPVIAIDWGNPTTLSVVGDFETYSWSTGETTVSIDVSSFDQRFYWVTVTGPGPCRESAMVLYRPSISRHSPSPRRVVPNAR